MKLYYLVLIIGLVARYGGSHAEEFNIDDTEDNFKEEDFEEDDFDESGDGDDKDTESGDNNDDDEKCSQQCDIGGLFDVSQSIDPQKFRKYKWYAQTFLSHITDTRGCHRFALAKFSDFATSEVFFNTPDNKKSARRALNDMAGPLSTDLNEVDQSRIDFGLATANNLLFSEKLGMRAKSKKSLVILTDGIQGPDTREIEASVKKSLLALYEKGVRVWVIQLGSDPTATELLQRIFGKKRVYSRIRAYFVLAGIIPGKTFDF